MQSVFMVFVWEPQLYTPFAVPGNSTWNSFPVASATYDFRLKEERIWPCAASFHSCRDGPDWDSKEMNKTQAEGIKDRKLRWRKPVFLLEKYAHSTQRWSACLLDRVKQGGRDIAHLWICNRGYYTRINKGGQSLKGQTLGHKYPRRWSYRGYFMHTLSKSMYGPEGKEIPFSRENTLPALSSMNQRQGP